MLNQSNPFSIVKSRLPVFVFTLCCFTALAACTARSEPEIAPPPASVASVETFLPDGVRVIFKRSCESCHGYDGRGIAGIAPDMLRSFGHKAEEWEKYFINPQGAHPGAQMPSTVWMSQDEIKTFASFLASLNARDAAPVETPEAR